MFEEEEEDLAFLEQYGNDNGYSSDEGIGSDLEDTIMSMVQYGSTNNQTNAENDNGSFKVNDANNNNNNNNNNNSKGSRSEQSKNDNTIIFSDDDATNSETSDSDSSNYDQLSDTSNEELPQITRHIDLDLDSLNQQKSTEEITLDDNENEVNKRLQELIDRQIINRQRKSRKPLRYCQNCYLAGHTRFECPTCPDCGDLKHEHSYCPGIIFCDRCKQAGHFMKECVNDKYYGPCHNCNGYSHASQYCPTLIHIYLENNSPDTKYKRFEKYCYNCGDEGHLGDDCPDSSDYNRYKAITFSSKVFKNKSITSPTNDESIDNKDSGKENSDNESNNTPTSSQPSSPSSKKRKFKNKKDKYNKSDKNYKSNEYQKRYKDNDYNDHNKSYKSKYNNDKYKSGNNNWKALSQQQSFSQSTSSPSSSLPRPSRTGYMNISQYLISDFPRNENTLPKPSRSGYTNTNERKLPKPTRSGNMDDLYKSNSKSKYKGGYRRN